MIIFLISGYYCRMEVNFLRLIQWCLSYCSFGTSKLIKRNSLKLLHKSFPTSFDVCTKFVLVCIKEIEVMEENGSPGLCEVF